MSSRPDAASRPTLLVFSLGPEADCRRRPVLPGHLRSMERELRGRCVADILDAGRACGLALEIATSHGAVNAPDIRRVEQRGSTFGERVASAVSDSWRRNPGGPVVLVGGDIPQLAPRHLRRALRLVRRDPDAVVIGPSPDGGFYLLATARPIDDVLADVRWCRGSARRDLIRSIERLGRSVHQLEPLADLDRPSDLAALLQSPWSLSAARFLARRIRSALRAATRPATPPSIGRRLTALATAQPHRGPPA